MRRAISSYAPLALLLVLVPAARADVVVTMVLDGTHSGAYDGIYISPYSLSVDGGKDVLLNCDDFVHNVNIGDTWDAKVFPGNSGDLRDTQMGKDVVAAAGLTGDPTAAEALADHVYDAKAWIELNKLNPAPLNSYGRALASYAIWDLFQPTAVDNYLTFDTTFRTSVDALAHDALYNEPISGLHQYLTIYSPNGPITGGPDANPNNFAQEYDNVNVPDGGTTVMFLGGALLGLATLRRKWQL